MKMVCDRNQCNGCMACMEICPQKAIHITDELANYNAHINEGKCNHCNLCQKVCPNRKLVSYFKPIRWYQGWAQEESIRMNSSSGGVASAIAVRFLIDGGEVCACLFKNGKFHFECINNQEAVSKMAGSKYVKSNPEGIYTIVQEKLKRGKKILFIGLPCQVAALKNYIRADMQNNLYTIDLICHGTPSPQLLELFLQQYGYSLKTIDDIQFRANTLYQIMSHGVGISTVAGVNDKYTIGFLQGLFNSENCYNCKYAMLNRVGDITLGDSWGSNLSEEEKQKGISLILIQTQKGEELIAQTELHKEDVDLCKAVESNPQLMNPTAKPEKRELFFRLIVEGRKFNTAIFYCCLKKSIKQEIKSALMSMKLLK